ncbi:hypothetical protein AB0173_25150, partial [Klebsiella quasipneumoniae]|uniref:hypothetical protein n=1 Tax=Klebsiella quasipneumoniae TaxID=1463165 RepID=UPI003450A735
MTFPGPAPEPYADAPPDAFDAYDDPYAGADWDPDLFAPPDDPYAPPPPMDAAASPFARAAVATGTARELPA